MFDQKNRVLTGIRPTGALHLGHHVGALKQWLPLQDDYECYFLIADIQALTTHADNPAKIRESVREVLLDFLAVGLNPHKRNVHFVLQSGMPELTYLYTLLSMVTPKSWIDINPTIKAEAGNLKSPMTLGFFDYPVSQAADILFCSFPPKSINSGEILVPVGEDQLPHLEGTNNIAKKFNKQYGPVFSTCKPLIGDIGRLVGTDGKGKMSKSAGNVIQLKDTEDVLRKAVKRMYTDPNRLHPTDKGNVEGNPVFMYLDAFDTDSNAVDAFKARYRDGTVGDVEVKEYLFEVLNSFLKPIRERRAYAEKNEDLLGILTAGTKKARELAKVTLENARKAAGLVYENL